MHRPYWQKIGPWYTKNDDGCRWVGCQKYQKDDSKIEEVVKKVISDNPDSVKDYKDGHDRAIKYLMGQVMKETKGSINPKLAMDILIKELS